MAVITIIMRDMVKMVTLYAEGKMLDGLTVFEMK